MGTKTIIALFLAAVATSAAAGTKSFDQYPVDSWSWDGTDPVRVQARDVVHDQEGSEENDDNESDIGW